jgi:hypothetical protein
VPRLSPKVEDTHMADEGMKGQKSMDQELQELAAEFADLGFDGADLSALDDDVFKQFEATVQAAGLGGGEFESMSLETLADDQADLAFLGGFLKGKVKKLLDKLVALVRRHGPKLARCVPLVTKAIGLFKAGKYASALKAAYDAYRCIRRAL